MAAEDENGGNEDSLNDILISEAVTPDTETFDPGLMSQGQPGLPTRFAWRGRQYAVQTVLRTWKNFRGCRNGSGEKYVNKHFYEIRTGGGETMTLYCTRMPGKRQEWTLYTMKKESADNENSNVKPLRAGVLVSGGGTNLQAILDARLEKGAGIYTVELVISDKEGVFAMERARRANVPTALALPPEGTPPASREERRRAVSERVLSLAREYDLDILVLAGFLTILTEPLVSEYAGRIINLHPALLPKFGGPGMYGSHVHEAVLASGESESGCTVHLADSGCDTGPILLQRRVPVLAGDTADTLAERIHTEEHIAIVEGIIELAKRMGRLSL